MSFSQLLRTVPPCMFSPRTWLFSTCLGFSLLPQMRIAEIIFLPMFTLHMRMGVSCFLYFPYFVQLYLCCFGIAPAPFVVPHIVLIFDNPHFLALYTIFSALYSPPGPLSSDRYFIATRRRYEEGRPGGYARSYSRRASPVSFDVSHLLFKLPGKNPPKSRKKRTA